MTAPRGSGPAGGLSKTIPVAGDVEVRVQLTADPPEAPPHVDLRLYRRSPSDRSALAFVPTAAGFRLPAHLGQLLAESIADVCTPGSRSPVPHAGGAPDGQRWELPGGRWITLTRISLSDPPRYEFRVWHADGWAAAALDADAEDMRALLQALAEFAAAAASALAPAAERP